MSAKTGGSSSIKKRKKMKSMSTLHSSRKKARNKNKLANGSPPVLNTSDAVPVQESNKYSLVTPLGENSGKPCKLHFDADIPILSVDEFDGDDKNSVLKILQAEKEKEDRAILSSLPKAVSKELDGYESQIGEADPLPNSYVRFIERTGEELDGEVEYDLDEEDAAWLSIVNERRTASGLTPNLEADTFELLMDRLEKESYFQQQSNGASIGAVVTAADEDAVCCICMDGECQNSNAILFCDMCNLAVHQDCYGVPYIPEGQWLCRRCLQSPSRAVDCALCPNRGGAFKQTDRPASWAHVVCALWIPEVRFANTVFLEPIDSIESIPAARWRLTCAVCKRRGVGACIQCHKSNCYAAFHVTCAQQAGLCMRMRTVQPANGEPMLVQKTAYCETHTPPDFQPSTNPADARRRAIANKKSSSAPVISIPTIPPERIREIAKHLTDGLPKKNQLIQRLIAYWTLKRQYRNGVPLLRRLQSTHPHPRAPASLGDVSPTPDSEVRDEMYRQLKYWQCLRQDLERARLLCELVRKREKLKKELFRVKEKCLWFELRPLESVLRIILDYMRMRDPNEIFAYPVNVEEVPDYLDIVANPMDLSTMEAKINRQEYDSIAAFSADFNLMIDNCLAYNRKDTMFYRAGIKMRESCSSIIEQARKDYPELDISGVVDEHMIIDEPSATKSEPAAKQEKLPREQSTGSHHQHSLSKSRKRERSSRVRNDSDTRTREKDTSSTTLNTSPASGTNVANVSSGSVSLVSGGGVNRRTAVLFTRKAKARASRGQVHRTSPESGHQVQKKQSDSFRVYRSGATDSDIGERESQSSSCSSCSTSRSTSPDHDDEDDDEDDEEQEEEEEEDENEGEEEEEEDNGDDEVESQEESQDSSPVRHRSREPTTATKNASRVLHPSENVSASEVNSKMETESDGTLSPLQLVWAKCRGYPWYPALIIDPNMPKGYIHRGMPIPSPPDDVLALGNNYKDPVYLVLFFDTKRTWQWLPGEKLESLGVFTELDNSKLIESRKPTDRKAVKKAYQDALNYQKQTCGNDSSPLNASTSD